LLDMACTVARKRKGESIGSVGTTKFQKR
jgi:hypothetical protein